MEQAVSIDTTRTKAGARAGVAQRPNGKLRAETILGFPVGAKMWSTVTEITPEDAELLLKTMPAQRKLRRRKVDHFASLMRAGRFRVTHQGIGIDRDGHTIDGQHRLNAIVDYGSPVQMQVTFGLDPDVFSCLDRGATRTIADDLTTAGVATGVTALILQAAARILWNYDAGRLPWRDDTAPSLGDVLAVIERHEHLERAAELAGTTKLVPPGAFAALWTLMCERDEKAAEDFAKRLFTGEGLTRDDPVYTLRENLIAERQSRHKKAIREAFMVRLVRTWNACRQGRMLTKISGALREGSEFPRVI